LKFAVKQKEKELKQARASFKKTVLGIKEKSPLKKQKFANKFESKSHYK